MSRRSRVRFAPNTKFSDTNPMGDYEVVQPPDDCISSLAFSPAAQAQTFLVAGSWDNSVRCWEIEPNVNCIPKSMKSISKPVLDVAWNNDGTKVFLVGNDNQANMWDLESNQLVQIGEHDAPIKTCHWINAPNYTCLMTGSWDKTLKFWDTRCSNPMLSLQLPERCYCADVVYPMAVVGTAGRHVMVYKLEGMPEARHHIKNAMDYQLRCVTILKDKNTMAPTGFASGSVDGKVSMRYLESRGSKANFSFRCHRSKYSQTGFQDIYAVNDIAVHPVHGTLSTVGSDGIFSFWDPDARKKIMDSKRMEQPINTCAFNHTGEFFAYAVSYDWSKGHAFYDPAKKNYIFLRNCFNELKPFT